MCIGEAANGIQVGRTGGQGAKGQREVWCHRYLSESLNCRMEDWSRKLQSVKALWSEGDWSGRRQIDIFHEGLQATEWCAGNVKRSLR